MLDILEVFTKYQKRFLQTRKNCNLFRGMFKTFKLLKIVSFLEVFNLITFLSLDIKI